MNGNRCRTLQTHNRDITNVLLTSFFLVRTVSYGSWFFPPRFMAHALRAWAINRRGKNSVSRGIYFRARWKPLFMELLPLLLNVLIDTYLSVVAREKTWPALDRYLLQAPCSFRGIALLLCRSCRYSDCSCRCSKTPHCTKQCHKVDYGMGVS